MTWTQAAVDMFLQLAPFTRFVLWLLFFLILPLLCERLRIPGVLGFLVMGFLLGPSGFNLLQPEMPIAELAAELGVALLLFFVGYDIDFALLRRAKAQVLLFGVLTFALPMGLGYGIARSAGYSVNAALLIGSLIASHTLLAYPVVNRLGLSQRVSVMVACGATVFTDVAAMLVLAMCLITHERGFSIAAIELQVLQIAFFIPAVVVGGPWLLRRILARMKRDESRIIVFFLAVAVASQAAELFGLDGIVGAFLAGIAVRQAAPESRNAGVMKLISDTFLIPAFFMTTGMLLHPIDALMTFVRQPLLAFGLLFALVVGKGLAAFALRPMFRYETADVMLVWSLTLPQVAATLAAATVAYRTLSPTGAPLLDESLLNVVLMLVVLSSLCAPLLTQRFGRECRVHPTAVETGGPPPSSRLSP
ncbi:hypothetical protein CEK29_12615 [Bordetella genomosp. 5]|uniref:cation:proton antiporter n=1 Tax=Bordetella genomosp. 5 TaxID=1395608 RepID=UPI000B9E12D4|nr:cation:proton antiporter [Bordetella genomosp. 5]OZI42581.1 hypothetical protein CEK29_12615 [Bordetella genomosp. 5]